MNNEVVGQLIGSFVISLWSYLMFCIGVLFESFRRDVLGYKPKCKDDNEVTNE